MVVIKNKLTEKTQEIAKLVAQGYSNKDIAELSNITIGSANKYLGALYEYYYIEGGRSKAARYKLIEAIKRDLYNDLD